MRKADYLTDLRAGIRENRSWVERKLLPLEISTLAWKPGAREWSVLECLEHLRLTHEYYRLRIEPALSEATPAPERVDADVYRPSHLGRIYMFFAFNPRMRFPAPGPVVPAAALDDGTLQGYLDDLNTMEALVARAENADLTKTPVPLERGARFNLGDVFKVLVGHDALHLDQARRVLEAHAAAAAAADDPPRRSE